MAEQCAERLRPAEVRVHVSPLSVAYNFSKNTPQLTVRKTAGAHGITLGLTEVSEEFGIQSTASLMQFPDGQGCLRPGFEVAIKLDPQTVFIGREFPKGSCAFNEIMAHEQRHVAANQAHAEKVARALEAEMRRAFANNIYYGLANGLEAELIRVVKTGWLPHLKAELKKSELLHKQIDNQQEYARMGTMCNGEVGRVLRP